MHVQGLKSDIEELSPWYSKLCQEDISTYFGIKTLGHRSLFGWRRRVLCFSSWALLNHVLPCDHIYSSYHAWLSLWSQPHYKKLDRVFLHHFVHLVYFYCLAKTALSYYVVYSLELHCVLEATVPWERVYRAWWTSYNQKSPLGTSRWWARGQAPSTRLETHSCPHQTKRAAKSVQELSEKSARIKEEMSWQRTKYSIKKAWSVFFSHDCVVVVLNLTEPRSSCMGAVIPNFSPIALTAPISWNAHAPKSWTSCSEQSWSAVLTGLRKSQ